MLKRPLLICPPWINKFYILDLNPEKSFIRWAVSQGHTVFVISWVNPDERHGSKGWEAYIREGIEYGLDIIEKATGEREVNAIGYCVGGTLLAAALALMAQEGDERIRTVTFFTTQVDFTYAGDLKVFVDEDQVAAVERSMNEKGYLEGTKMATAFNMLRSGDLIWPYVVNNYMRGKDPMPFDLLYWNADSTRMGAANHSFYLRNCYLENNLTNGRMELAGRTVLARRHQDPGLQPCVARGPHRPFPLGLPRLAIFRRTGRVRDGRVRPHRRRRQPASSRRNTSTGPAASRSAISTTGSRRPRRIPVPGGRTGKSGSRTRMTSRVAARKPGKKTQGARRRAGRLREGPRLNHLSQRGGKASTMR